MSKSKKTAVTNWLDGAPEVPREDVTANQDRSKRQRFYRRFIVASIILLPLSLGANILILGDSIGNPPATSHSAVQLNPAGRAAATMAVQEWLDSDVSPLPGQGKILSWDGAKVQPKPVVSDDSAQAQKLPKYDIEIHSFTLEDGLHSTYTVTVQVAVDPSAGAQVLGTPSLVPVAATDASIFGNTSPWMGKVESTPPDAVKSAIKAWAKAFTSGDPDALRLAVQDDNGKHVYVPLSNVADHTVEVIHSAYIADEGSDQSKKITKSTRMISQVQLSVEWVGAPARKDNATLPKITYDLLIEKVGGGAPVIVAWGGPGTAPEFKAYQNALTGRQASASVGADKVEAKTPTPGDVPAETPVEPVPAVDQDADAD